MEIKRRQSRETERQGDRERAQCTAQQRGVKINNFRAANNSTENKAHSVMQFSSSHSLSLSLSLPLPLLAPYFGFVTTFRLK